MIDTFDERRTAQALAWLLHRGGPLAQYKLLRLLYQAERISLVRHGDLISGDVVVATRLGPEPLHTSKILDGQDVGSPDGILTFVRKNHEGKCELAVSITSETCDKALGALSDTDVECLEASWSTLGRRTVYELARMTFSNALPEWNQRMVFMEPIALSCILRALNVSPAKTEAILDRARQTATLAASFAGTPGLSGQPVTS